MRVISVKPITGKPTHYTVLWLLGNTCPYSCSYCNSTFNGGNIAFQPASVVLKGMSTLPRAHVIFSGGEPTYHPEFERLLSERPKNVKISVLSNASRPYDFWSRIHDKLLSVVLSYHIEHTIYSRFIEIARLCKPRLQRVNLPMLRERWSDCMDVYTQLVQEGIPVSAKPIVENFGFEASKVVGYTEEQRQWIDAHNTDTLSNNLLITFEDGTSQITSPSRLLNSGLTNFSGMNCWTQTEFLHVDFDGTVFNMSCKQREFLGNIQDGFVIPTDPVVCKQSFCWCHTDIIPQKSAVDV